MSQDSPKPPKYTGLTHLYKATTYSLAGLKACLKHEAAFRHDLLFAVVNTVLVLVLPLSNGLRALVICLSLVLLACELLNSALEAIVDLVCPQRHELAGRAKDMGSAAVFCLLTALFVAWGFCLWDLLLRP